MVDILIISNAANTSNVDTKSNSKVLFIKKSNVSIDNLSLWCYTCVNNSNKGYDEDGFFVWSPRESDGGVIPIDSKSNPITSELEC